eukprot:2595797-Amphidinium_carterae.1
MSSWECSRSQCPVAPLALQPPGDGHSSKTKLVLNQPCENREPSKRCQQRISLHNRLFTYGVTDHVMMTGAIQMARPPKSCESA